MNFFKKMKRNAKLLLLLLLCVVLLLLILFIILIGFSWWFWVLQVYWLLFFAGYLNWFMKFNLSFKIWMVLYAILFIITLVLLITLSSSGGSSSKNSSKSIKKLSAEECKPIIEKYNNKILKISGDGLTGTVGLKIDAGNCRIKGQYIVTFKSELGQNPGNFDGSALYYYMIRMHKPGDDSRGYNDYGAISPVLTNKGVLPDPFAGNQEIAQFYRALGMPDQATDQFYFTYTIDTDFSEARYQQILSDVVFEAVDTNPYIVVTDEGDGMKTYSVDHDKAEKEGRIVKTINTTITE